jgi:hypothetical protein
LEDKKKMPFYSNISRGKSRDKGGFHLEVDTKARMVDIINMKVNCMEVDEEIFKEGEVMETVVEIIEVNN